MAFDLTLPVIYNGHTSQPAYATGGQPVVGCVIRAITPQTPTAFTIQKSALSDGAPVSDTYLSGMTLHIVVECYGRSPEEMWDQVALFKSAYSPRSPGLLISSPLQYQAPSLVGGWSSNRIPLYMTCSPIAEPYTAPETKKQDTAGSHLIQCYAVLYAPDPYQYVNQSRQVLSVTTVEQWYTYRGDSAAQQNVELWFKVNAGGNTGIQLCLDSPYGRSDLGYSRINLALTALGLNQTYVLSFANKLVTLAGVAVAGVIGAGSIFGSVVPGGGCYYTGDSSHITLLDLHYPEAFF